MKHLVPGLAIQEDDCVEFRYNGKLRKGTVSSTNHSGGFFTVEHDDGTFKSYKFPKVEGRIYILI